jgi:uncharacterized protein YcbX
MQSIRTIGLDIAKLVFQVHGVYAAGQVVVRRRLRRRHILAFFQNVFPVSVMTSSTLARLNELSPNNRFDERRFRINVIVKTPQPGFVENGWVGRELALGGSVRLNVALPDPRCVMTTLAQEDLPKDTEILRTLVHHNRIDLPGLGQYPCAGAYAVVTSQGGVQVGDAVLS